MPRNQAFDTRRGLSEREHYDVQHVARLTGRHPHLILRWARAGKIKSRRATKWPYEMLFSPTAIVAILEMPKRQHIDRLEETA